MNIEEIKERLAINEIACEDDLIDLSPDVKYLLSIIEQQAEEIEQLRLEHENFMERNSE